MSWNCSRQVTKHDYDNLEKVAEKFNKRHNIKDKDNFGLSQYELVTEYVNDKANMGDTYLRKLWIGCFRRCVRLPFATGVAYGYIGHRVN